MLLFTWLVSRQSLFIAQKNYFTALKTVNENEVASISAGTNIYDNGSSFEDEKHYYSADLDIFGKASLYQLASRAATWPGKHLLAGWLSAPANKGNIHKRQE
jgi:hypothetical protein